MKIFLIKFSYIKKCFHIIISFVQNVAFSIIIECKHFKQNYLDQNHPYMYDVLYCNHKILGKFSKEDYKNEHPENLRDPNYFYNEPVKPLKRNMYLVKSPILKKCYVKLD